MNRGSFDVHSGISIDGQDPCPEEFADAEFLSLEVAARWLRHCGRGVKIYKRSRFVHPNRISIGDFSQIDECVRIFAGEGVAVGRHVHMAFGSSISGGGTATIGDFVGIGAGVRLITGTEIIEEAGLTNPTVPTEFRRVRRGKIEIGAHSVVFTNTIILPDVVIGEGAVIGAGSIVHRSLKPWSMYAGNPLVQIGVRERDRVVRQAHELSQQEKSD